MRGDVRTRPGTLAVGVLLAGLTTVLTACSTGPEAGATDAGCLSGDALVLVVPVHQGAQRPGVPAAWDCALDAAVRTGTPVGVVTAEGRPQVLLRDHAAAVDGGNELAVADEVVAAKNAIISVVAGATASSDGNDALAAYALAADLAGPGGQILSLDNGATDTGVVRTVEPGMTTVVDPADTAQLVLDQEACPAVSGLRVELYGVGSQVAPAAALSQRQRDRLAHTWRAILAACGAEVVVVALPRTGEGPVTTHTARPVAPEAAPEMPAGETAGAHPCEAVLPDATVGFVADEATFLDTDQARAVVDAVARQVALCPGRVEVVGTTSSAGTPEGRARVSTGRAEAIRALLAAALDVPADTVDARGLGYDEGAGGCVVDRVDGVLQPVLAAQNRKVTIRVVP